MRSMAHEKIIFEDGKKIREEFLKVLESRQKSPVLLEVKRCTAPPDAVEKALRCELPLLGISAAEAENLEEERLLLTTEGGEQGKLPVLIIKPKSYNNKSQGPAILVLHNSYRCKDTIRPLLDYYAFHGYTAISIDSRYHGERASSETAYQNALISAWKTGEEMPFIFDTVRDVMRLMDYLVGRADIDAKCIGMTGVSLGGMITLYSVAADCRIAAAVPIIGVQNFSWAVKNNKWQARVASIPHVFEVAAKDLGKSCVDSETVEAVWKRIVPGLIHQFDVEHMLKAVAPRPLLILNGKEDPRCPVEGLEYCIRETCELYKELGHQEEFQFVAEENVGHKTTESMLKAAKSWFDKYLMNNSNHV